MRKLLILFAFLVAFFVSCGNSPKSNIDSKIEVSAFEIDSSIIDTSILADNGEGYVTVKKYRYVSDLIYDNCNLSEHKGDSTTIFELQGVYFDKRTLIVVVDMYLQGWRYFMPIPKSAQAKHGSTDGRTTWWDGYWQNINSKELSKEMPKKDIDGLYYRNGKMPLNKWRNGGCPGAISKIQWVLSSSGTVVQK